MLPVTIKNEDEVATSRPENKRPSVLLDVVEDEILPSSVKPLAVMTEEERVVVFDEFNTLKAEMTPIAIKHCHKIKSPFPKKDFNLICRDLFAVGTLDKENVKLAVEKAFEEKCKGRLNDFQLNLVLKHYCIDMGVSKEFLRKIDILSVVPKKCLNLKHYWELMYRLRQTNLFSDAELGRPEAAKKRRNDSNPSNAPSKSQNSAKAYDKTAEPSTNPAVSTKQRECNRGRIKWAELPAKHYSNCNKGHFRETEIGFARCFEVDWIKKQNQQGNHGNLQVKPKRFSKNRRNRHKRLNEQEKLNLPPPKLSTETMIFSRNCIPEPNFSAQNLVKPNFTPHSNIGEPGSSNSLWPVESSHLENIGHNRTEISEHYSRNSGFDEHSKSQVYGSCFLGREYNHLENIGHDRAGIPNDYSRDLDFYEHSRIQEYGKCFPGKPKYDNLVAGTSRQDWSEGESSSWKYKNKSDDLEQGKKGHKRLKEPVKTSLPIAPLHEMSTMSAKPTFQNNQELSSRKREDNDWRFVRGVPPQKKSTFVEDVQPKTSKSIDLQRSLNDFEDRMNNKNIGKLSESMNSSRRSLGRVSPQSINGNLCWTSPPWFGGESRKPTVMENPPFIVPGIICKVAVVHDDYPKTKITSNEAGLIRNELWERIGVQRGVVPRFSDTYEEGGAVVFECEDQITVFWIWVNARNIIPWRNARLRPTSWEKPPNEISIEIPRMLQSLTPEDLCQRLKNQNPELSTEYWKFKLADETAAKGRELGFYIDDDSMKKLKSCYLRPCLGFSRVKVHVIHESTTKQY